MDVELSKTAVKQLKRTPVHVLRKFEGWVRRIEEVGMAATRQVPGYHDEPLLGKLIKGPTFKAMAGDIQHQRQ